MTTRKHNPATVPAPVGQYVQGLELEPGARLLFISGQIPEAVDGAIPEGFETQCRLVWSNLGEVLRAAGMTLTNLVKVTTYLSDRRYGELNSAIRREVLAGHEPALTVVVVETLDRRWLLEIEAIAACAKS